MNTYKRHRFPPDIISYAVWLYYRFNLSHRDIEYLLAERGITVSHESIRLWCIKFRARYARRLKRKHRGYGDTFYIDPETKRSTANARFSRNRSFKCLEKCLRDRLLTQPRAAISPKAIDDVADDGSMTITVQGVANEYPLCPS
jgi:transposase-like protein